MWSSTAGAFMGSRATCELPDFKKAGDCGHVGQKLGWSAKCNSSPSTERYQAMLACMSVTHRQTWSSPLCVCVCVRVGVCA